MVELTRLLPVHDNNNSDTFKNSDVPWSSSGNLVTARWFTPIPHVVKVSCCTADHAGNRGKSHWHRSPTKIRRFPFKFVTWLIDEIIHTPKCYLRTKSSVVHRRQVALNGKPMALPISLLQPASLPLRYEVPVRCVLRSRPQPFLPEG